MYFLFAKYIINVVVVGSEILRAFTCSCMGWWIFARRNDFTSDFGSSGYSPEFAAEARGAVVEPWAAQATLSQKL